MHITTIETPGLGDRSYVIDDGTTAIVIDPQRDIDRVQDVLIERGLQLAVVCETHIHNDYVTGGLALSRSTGADYLISAADEVAFTRREVTDGEQLSIGDVQLTVLATPGHTPTHLSYLVEGSSSAVFTGGSMLYGTVGRTDLISADMTEQLTRDQYRSVRRMAAELPPQTTVWPTHGFGSFCASAGGGSRDQGTVADERDSNIAVTTEDEEEFVSTLINGLTAYPPYYAHMGLLNRAGPLPPDLSPPPRATPEELSRRIAAGEWVVDLRPRQEFAARHLAGSVSVDGEGALATYLGWAIPWGTPLALLGRADSDVEAAQRELVRIGLDRPLAMASGGVDTYAKDQEVGSYPVRTFADLADHPEATVIDVRRQDEWDEGHFRDARHITMEQLETGAANLPAGPLWVHCAAGFRSSIAASLIARAGKDVVYVDDEWDNAARSGRTITTEEEMK